MSTASFVCSRLPVVTVYSRATNPPRLLSNDVISLIAVKISELKVISFMNYYLSFRFNNFINTQLISLKVVAI